MHTEAQRSQMILGLYGFDILLILTLFPKCMIMSGYGVYLGIGSPIEISHGIYPVVKRHPNSIYSRFSGFPPLLPGIMGSG
jgi:hypothetical protein